MNLVLFYDTHSRRIFAILALICAVSAFCYGAFLLEAVGNTAARAHAAEDIKALRSKLSDAETAYLHAAQSLTPSLAQELGFVAPKKISTVYATDESRVLTLKTDSLSALAQ